MHVHILGIGGTFMGGVAAIAKAAGFRVTGSDLNVYPPMSTQLEALGIELVQGYGAEQLDLRPDIVVVGNALSRGSPVVEAMLDRGMAYTSGPQWLAEQVLREQACDRGGRHARQDHDHRHADVDTRGRGSGAGISDRRRAEQFRFHGALRQRTRSSSSRRMSTTRRFSTSARNSCTTVRAPRFSTIWNTITRTSIRMSPRSAASSINCCAPCRRRAGSSSTATDAELAATLSMGCWTPRETFALAGGGLERSDSAGIGGEPLRGAFPGQGGGRGELAAAGRAQCHECAGGDRSGASCRRGAGACGAGARAVPRRQAPHGNSRRGQRGHGVRRFRASPDGHRDHAARTARAGGGARIIAVLEPRSNTMKLGVHREQLAPSLELGGPGVVLEFAGHGLGLAARPWRRSARAQVSPPTSMPWSRTWPQDSRPGDHILVMSNGGFGGLHDKLLAALRARAVISRCFRSISCCSRTVRCRCGFSKRATSTWCARCMRESEQLRRGVDPRGQRSRARRDRSMSGTLAKIVDFHQLSDGLLGLSCVGGQRFRIRSRSRQADGLNLAEVEHAGAGTGNCRCRSVTHGCRSC